MTYVFFFNDTATTEIYTLSLHDALPIWEEALDVAASGLVRLRDRDGKRALAGFGSAKCSNEEAYLFQKLVRTGFGSNNVRSEEHTSELQSRQYLVCRLLLEKKKRKHDNA